MEAKRNSEIASLYYECMCVLLFCFVFFFFFREVKSSFYKYLKTSIVRGVLRAFYVAEITTWDAGVWEVFFANPKTTIGADDLWPLGSKFEKLFLQDSLLIWNITDEIWYESVCIFKFLSSWKSISLQSSSNETWRILSRVLSPRTSICFRDDDEWAALNLLSANLG